jgi:N-acetylglutamate synthase
MTDDTDLAARALLSALRLIVREVPGLYEKPAGPDVVSLVSGLPEPILNGVFAAGPSPELGQLKDAADGLAGLALPWSIQLRGEPGWEAEQLAASYGRTGRVAIPLMVCDLTRHEPDRPARAAGRVRVVGPGDQPAYVAALAAGFEVPPDRMAPFGAPQILARPEVVAYAADDDGQVVSVGLGLFSGDCAGVFNIATRPAYRGRGYGRAMTSRIMADGLTRGARLAYLQSTPAGYSLYRSLGFRTAETWNYLIPG